MPALAPSLSEFRHLMSRVEARDQAACAEFVELFQTEIYRTVRLPLIGMGLQSLIDPMDICQAVFAGFFSRVVGSDYDLCDPMQVKHLLLTMARNKVRDESRRYMAQRRNRSLLVHASEDCLQAVPDEQSTPSSLVGRSELVEKIRGQLSPEERAVVEQRALGQDWAALAKERGCTPEALRKKMDRAIERVSRSLGLR